MNEFMLQDISDSMIQPYHQPWLKKATDNIPPKLKKK